MELGGGEGAGARICCRGLWSKMLGSFPGELLQEKLKCLKMPHFSHLVWIIWLLWEATL